MASLRFSLFFLLFALCIAEARAADPESSLDCKLQRSGVGSLPLHGRVVDGEGVLKTTELNELELGLDASLAGGSFMVILQDQQKQQRLAFVGSPLGMGREGAVLGLPGSSVDCHRVLPADKILPARPPQKTKYLVCVLDEAFFEGGDLKSTTREIVSKNSALAFGRPRRIQGKTEKYSFSVDYLAFDPVHGLKVEITDKATQQTATYDGPGASLVSSFLFGFTQGDKNVKAKFLRLGCMYTNQPELYADPDKDGK